MLGGIESGHSQLNDGLSKKESPFRFDMNQKGQSSTMIDYSALHNDTNHPLIITGDEGCGKTHSIIKWLMKFNQKNDGVIDEEDEFDG